MRLQCDRYACAICGAVLDIPLDARPKVMFKESSGTSRVRVLSIDRREIHSCEMPSN